MSSCSIIMSHALNKNLKSLLHISTCPSYFLLLFNTHKKSVFTQSFFPISWNCFLERTWQKPNHCFVHQGMFLLPEYSLNQTDPHRTGSWIAPLSQLSSLVLSTLGRGLYVTAKQHWWCRPSKLHGWRRDILDRMMWSGHLLNNEL